MLRSSHRFSLIGPSSRGELSLDILYIVMPAYNEEENLDEVVNEWYPVIEAHPGGGKSRLVIVNDGSRDRTYEIGQRLMQDRPQLVVLDKPNSGHGATVLYAYHYALDNGADYIFQTDSDGQTRPAEFEQFWDKRMNYRAIIGHRNHREDGFSRLVVTKVLKLVLFVIFGLSITDANTPFRLMQRELLKEYITDVPKDFNLSNVMLSVLFIYNNEKVLFLPITFRPRQGGVNSLNIPRIVRIGWNAVQDFFSIRRHMHKHAKKGVRQ